MTVAFAVALSGGPALLGGCQDGAPAVADSGLTPYVLGTQADDKSKLYNLIGRWYPVSEVKRLRDENVTPEEWCQREPGRLTIMPDQVEVRCADGQVHSAALARVSTSTKVGEITLSLRVAKDRPWRLVRFEGGAGPTAIITGLPCFGGGAEPHQRFPELEILTRQILGGRRCAQLEAQLPVRTVTPSPTVPDTP